MSSDSSVNAMLFNMANRALHPEGGDGAVPNKPAQPPASKEDLQWLKEAMKNVEMPDKMMKRFLDAIRKPDATADEFVNALEQISDHVEDLNFAVEFVLMDGHTTVLQFLADKDNTLIADDPEIRRLLALTIAHASQQNEMVQDAFNKAEWASVIVPAMIAEKEKGPRAALLHACSCMCRECENGSAAFLKAGGLELLHEIVHPLTGPYGDPESINNEKIIMRALFLIQHFAMQGISSTALIDATLFYIKKGTNDVERCAAACLLSLIEKSPTTVKSVAAESLGDYGATLNVKELAEGDERLKLAMLLRKK